MSNKPVKQLLAGAERQEEFFPKQFMENIIDENTGENLYTYLSKFNHINVGYVANVISARKSVPNIFRRTGFYITYYIDDKPTTEFYIGTKVEAGIEESWIADDKWELFDGVGAIESHSITLDQLSDQVLALLGQGEHNIVNYPDGEDLDQYDICGNNGKYEINVLKFKDKKYNPANFSGDGYIILRKNIVDNKNILTADMISEKNTYYEVRYDFDLNGETIILPENTSLVFKGGHINNGTVIFNKGTILGIITFTDFGTATTNGVYREGLVMHTGEALQWWDGTKWKNFGEGDTSLAGAEVEDVETTKEIATASARLDNNIIKFSFGIPRGEPGKDGQNGQDGRPGQDGNGIAYINILAYTSTDDDTPPEIPVGGSYNFEDHIMTYPDGWYRDLNEQEGIVWMSQNTYNSDGTNTGWSEPFRISGPAGSQGKDGSVFEYIYKLSKTQNEKPSKPESVQEDDYVPEGWEDSPQGISEENTVEWVCLRIKVNNTWGDFTVPTIWSKWGVDGTDGDGVEYIYTITTGEDKPATPSTSEQTDEYIPPQGDNENPWTDNPTGVSVESQFEWVSIRKFRDGQWGAFSEPVIWAHYGINGTNGTIPNWKTYVYKKSDSKPEKPTSTDIVPEGWSDYPDNTGQWWQCIGTVNGETNKVTSWSEVLPVNGRDGTAQDGKFTEFRFAANDSKNTPPDLTNNVRTPSGWSTEPPTLTDGQFLWLTTAVINSNDTLYSNWTTPVRISGEQGPQGGVGPAGPPGGTGPTGPSGVPGVSIDVRYCIGTEDTPNGSSSPSGDNPDGWFEYIPKTDDQHPYIWCIQGKRVYSSAEDETGSINWSSPFRLSGTNGAPGSTGRKGQIIYPAGIYNVNATYVTDDNKAPYVLDTTDGKFYVLNAIMTWKGVEQDNKTPADSYKDSGGLIWMQFDMFDAIFTKIGIISNGLIGSAVFNGDYMFSQQGINPKNSNAITTEYQNFNPNNPFSSNNTFIPNICINYKTGEAWFAAGKVYFGKNGEGYVSNGAISWDSTGTASIKIIYNKVIDYIKVSSGNKIVTLDKNSPNNWDTSGTFQNSRYTTITLPDAADAKGKQFIFANLAKFDTSSMENTEAIRLNIPGDYDYYDIFLNRWRTITDGRQISISSSCEENPVVIRSDGEKWIISEGKFYSNQGSLVFSARDSNNLIYTNYYGDYNDGTTVTLCPNAMYVEIDCGSASPTLNTLALKPIGAYVGHINTRFLIKSIRGNLTVKIDKSSDLDSHNYENSTVTLTSGKVYLLSYTYGGLTNTISAIELG